MKIGLFGTGMVGEAIASKLIALGHEVLMGSRQPNHPKAIAWASRMGARAHAGTFEAAAKFGELLFNCTRGASSLDALHAAGERNIAGKILVDVANMLPPDASSSLSLGERIQRAFPETKVVKTLNTVNCDVMVDASRVRGTHTLFISGDHIEAKRVVLSMLESFGWRDVIDLGDITTARTTEAYLGLWLALWQALGTARFNIQVVR